MTAPQLKVTRIEPGRYSTEVRDKVFVITQGSQSKVWSIQGPEDDPMTGRVYETKKAAVTALEFYARSDRQTSREMTIPRRSKIEAGTQLHVEGFRGRCTFVGYTKSPSGEAREYVEIFDAKGRSRLIDPAKITQVHRTKRYNF